VAKAEAYLHAKFHLDPSNRLATVHERHRQTDRQDRQWSDSIGRTVLQMVAHKVTDDRQTLQKFNLVQYMDTLQEASRSMTVSIIQYIIV